MKTLFLLVRSHLLGHRIRTLLATFAIACSVCLLVWIVSVYSSVIRSLDLFASRSLGRYTLVVDPISTRADREVSPEALRILVEREEVETADPMWAQLLTLRSDTLDLTDPSLSEYSSEGGWEDVVVGTDADLPPFEMVRGRWLPRDGTDQWEAVISQDLAEKLNVDVGDPLEIVGPTDDRPSIEVIGVMGSPPKSVSGAVLGSRMFPSPSVGAVFCSMRDASAIHRTEPKITFIAVALREDTDVQAFRYAMTPSLQSLKAPSQFMTDLDLEEAMNEAAIASSMTLQAYVVGMMSVLLAFLVNFSTLSMGVSERVRQFALLRAITLSKVELALLVASEGIALACFGLFVGIPCGWLLVVLTDVLTDGLIGNGVQVEVAGIALAILVSLMASLFAALLPAWRATRVKPLEAMTPRNATIDADHRGVPLWCAFLALPLLGVLPTVSFLYPPGASGSVFGRLVVGAGCLAVGLLVLAPILIRSVDRWCARLVATCLRLPAELVQQQLTSQLWRTVSCALTMSVGMGLFAGIHVWGWSMVQVFIPSDWAPDATLVFEKALSDQAIEQLKTADGDLRFEPLIVEQPRLRDDVLNSAEFPSVTRQMVAVLAGLDPVVAFEGTNPLIDAEWYAGSPEDAIERMRMERGCVVPDHFLKQSNLQVGDDLYLVPPENPEKPVRYTIAGAIQLRGGQWMTKTTNMRQRTHRSAGLIFADFHAVLDDFDLPGPRHCFVDSKGSEFDAASALALAQSLPRDASAVGENDVQLMLTAEIGGRIFRSAALWLWVMSVVPMIAMAISSIAMINMFLASMRARQWDFGILRAVGYTRGDLVRLVMAEGVLVGLVACVVGCTFGVIAGWSGTALTQATSWFGGMDVPLAVPLTALVIGCLLMIAFAVFAAAWPAMRMGSVSPLKLLSHGRGVG